MNEKQIADKIYYTLLARSVGAKPRKNKPRKDRPSGLNCKTKGEENGS